MSGWCAAKNKTWLSVPLVRQGWAFQLARLVPDATTSHKRLRRAAGELASVGVYGRSPLARARTDYAASRS